jgi:hypothetical protein
VTVLPILLGIEPRQIDLVLPFLSDIRHLSIQNYTPSTLVDEYELKSILSELQSAVESSAKIKATGQWIVTSLVGSVRAASYCSEYSFFRILTNREMQEVGFHFGKISPEGAPKPLTQFDQFIRGLGGQADSQLPSEIACCWDDIEHHIRLPSTVNPMFSKERTRDAPRAALRHSPKAHLKLRIPLRRHLGRQRRVVSRHSIASRPNHRDRRRPHAHWDKRRRDVIGAHRDGHR